MRTVLSWYQSGGPMMVPLLLIGVAGVLLIAERLVYIVLRSRTHARPFMERVIALARANKVDEALELCVQHRSALPDLGLVILRSRSRNETDLLQVAEASALTFVPALTRRLSYFPVLAIVGLLVGLLGAIMNLHEALAQASSAVADAPANRGLLLGGVAYALRPLGIGVLTAIPLIAAHAYLVHAAQIITGHLDEFSARLVNALIDRPDVRLGHRNG